MTDKELMDLVRAVAFSPSPVKSSPAWQALKAHCTQPTDVQPLNGAIALLTEMVKVWNVHGVIHKDSWYYDRANAVIAQQATI